MTGAFVSAFLGGLLGGGLVSSVISSPQTQTIYWIKEPKYRWNIVLWDSVAFGAIFLVLSFVTKKRIFSVIGLSGLLIGIILSFYLYKKYEGEPEIVTFTGQTKVITKGV